MEFRYSDGYEDVFIEDDHFLYACLEPYDRACFWAVHEWRGAPGRLIRGEWAGADLEYLEGLEHAPRGVAWQIVEMETRELLERNGEDPDYWEEYARAC